MLSFIIYQQNVFLPILSKGTVCFVNSVAVGAFTLTSAFFPFRQTLVLVCILDLILPAQIQISNFTHISNPT